MYLCNNQHKSDVVEIEKGQINDVLLQIGLLITQPLWEEHYSPVRQVSQSPHSYRHDGNIYTSSFYVFLPEVCPTGCSVCEESSGNIVCVDDITCLTSQVEVAGKECVGE